MKKNYTALLSLLFLAVVVFVVFFTMMPQWITNNESLSEFSTQRALEHIQIISEKPHYVGSQNHEEVASYLEKELQKLGLQTTIQEGTTLSDWGNVVKSKNIIAQIKGSANSKALLLLSHYDSAPHSFSHGASDDASGVATILEGLRAFLHARTPHKNDIIILFSDAEELGLNGAALFVTQNQLAKNIGLALNFEARGSDGPGYMLMEVNRGNAALVKGFKEAHPKYPVSNSLMYSIYKLLPNDTDLTVFRAQGKIPGFNFAFIDGHYNYHTAQDNYAHVREKTIAHQGSYLMPLLKYFSNADLTHLDSEADFVYFNIPFSFVSYPFEWVLPMWIGALLFFLLLVFIGMGKRVLIMGEIMRGFIPLLFALALAGSITFFGWKLLLAVNPQYNDLINGFTYNGHDYIAAFVLLSFAIGFACYGRQKTDGLTLNQSIAPIFLWLCINFAIVFKLPGAGFFIIPVFATLLMLGYFVVTQSTNRFVNLLLSIPSIIIFAPFIWMFPIGLGLKILAGSAVLTILLFTLLLPVLGGFTKKWAWALAMLLFSVGFFVKAQLHSGYEYGQAKPNSLVYFLDADQNKAYWATYDVNLDEWTKTYLGNYPSDAGQLNRIALASKYNSAFTYSTTAPVKNLARPSIEFLRDSIGGTQRYLKIRITSHRNANRLDIFANPNMSIHNLVANGAKDLEQKGSLYQRNGQRIISYYAVDNEPLTLQFSISKATSLDVQLMESSFDLLSNPVFNVNPRKNWMMPTPFVLNDAVIILQKIKPTPAVVVPVVTTIRPRPAVVQDSLPAIADTIKAAP